MSRRMILLRWGAPAIAAVGWSLLFGIDGWVALLTGFPAHVARVWPQLTWNPDLWVPALIAFVLALVIGHALLRGPMAARGVHWRFDHTLCLFGFLPLAFATAFLVPGVLLQLRLLVDLLEYAA